MIRIKIVREQVAKNKNSIASGNTLDLFISDSAPVLDVPKPVSLDKNSVVAKQRKKAEENLQ